MGGVRHVGPRQCTACIATARGTLALRHRRTGVSVSTGRGYYLCTRQAADGQPAVEMFARWLLETIRGARGVG
jgi:hypothetical protein